MITAGTVSTVPMPRTQVYFLPSVRSTRLTVLWKKFAFGTSKKLTEHEVAVRLRFYMKALSQEQPLILLFHNAEAEKTYFEQMNIEVKDFVERVPMTVLNDIRNGRARRGEARSHIIILDTQRLYKSFTYETPDAYEQPQIALGKLAKKLGITPKYLHNAGEPSVENE